MVSAQFKPMNTGNAIFIQMILKPYDLTWTFVVPWASCPFLPYDGNWDMAKSFWAVSLTQTQLKVQNISVLIPLMIPARLKKSRARVTGPEVKISLLHCRRSAAPVCDWQGSRKILLPQTTDHHDCGKFLHQGFMSFFLTIPCELVCVLWLPWLGYTGILGPTAGKGSCTQVKA